MTEFQIGDRVAWDITLKEILKFVTIVGIVEDIVQSDDDVFRPMAVIKFPHVFNRQTIFLDQLRLYGGYIFKDKPKGDCLKGVFITLDFAGKDQRSTQEIVDDLKEKFGSSVFISNDLFFPDENFDEFLRDITEHHGYSVYDNCDKQCLIWSPNYRWDKEEVLKWVSHGRL